MLERILAAAGLAAASPVLIVAGVAVAVESGLPIVFRQTRVGVGGAPFTLYKLRSMRAGAPGAQVTAGGGPRVTRVGRILRASKFDELPQLWNVVKGDMGLVGPRPEVPKYVDPTDPLWKSVLRLKPGITDLATLCYRNEEEELAGQADPERYYREVVLPAKLRLNDLYAQARTPLADLRLLVLTVYYSLRPSALDPARLQEQLLGRRSGTEPLA